MVCYCFSNSAFRGFSLVPETGHYRTTGTGKPYKLEFFDFSETLLLSINQHNTEISHSFSLTLRRSLVHTNLQFIHKFIEQNKELSILGVVVLASDCFGMF